jgi:hypothetical protein
MTYDQLLRWAEKQAYKLEADLTGYRFLAGEREAAANLRRGIVELRMRGVQLELTVGDLKP